MKESKPLILIPRLKKCHKCIYLIDTQMHKGGVKYRKIYCFKKIFCLTLPRIGVLTFVVYFIQRLNVLRT